jgi:peptidoglycan L-alanyl-D-glutamate endopeptidase CwlK
MDKVSINRLNLLHPLLRKNALMAYDEAVQATPGNVHPFILETLRSFKRQQELYDQGRTKPGPIVTNAKPGRGFHQYGMAIDFANKVNGKINWKVDEHWITVVNIFKDHGWEWGGDWKSLKDYPHLQYTFGYTWKELLKLYNNKELDEEGYVIIKPK